jgi:hypothetical protein
VIYNQNMQTVSDNLFKHKNKRCLVCKKPKDTIYYHIYNNSDVWVYCCACGRSYTAEEYCDLGGIKYMDLLLSGIEFSENKPNEINRLEWPYYFISLFDVRAEPGRDYLRERGIDLSGEIYYDFKRKGIVFPMYYDMYFCGAQIRLIEPKMSIDGSMSKIISEPGTKTSILIYNWNQLPFLTDVKAIVITEGVINSLSLSQAMSLIYKDDLLSPYKFVALSGSSASDHHIEKFKELVDSGYKVIVAADNDDAGGKMIEKFLKSGAATHFSTPLESGEDWNDILVSYGKEELIKHFFSRMVKYGNFKN